MRKSHRLENERWLINRARVSLDCSPIKPFFSGSGSSSIVPIDYQPRFVLCEGGGEITTACSATELIFRSAALLRVLLRATLEQVSSKYLEKHERVVTRLISSLLRYITAFFMHEIHGFICTKHKMRPSDRSEIVNSCEFYLNHFYYAVLSSLCTRLSSMCAGYIF